jgi:hypothetical protein
MSQGGYMEEMAKMYLDWWEKYWEQAYSTTQSLDDMHRFWSAVAKSYEDTLKTS